MRVAIAGAGEVGQSIAQGLLDAGHRVLLIERYRPRFRPRLVPGAEWMLADACELATLQRAGIGMCDVAVGASGDDKVNLVFALLCKREFAVPRVVARVNEPANQGLFTAAWGVDVAVSTPATLVAAVDERVSTGQLVQLMTLQQHNRASIVEITVPEDAPLAGVPVGELRLPTDTALLAVVRDQRVLTAAEDARLLPGDELVFAAGADAHEALRAVFADRP
ncbi:MAG TPA: TrkA family potassium uptake protein [Jatrophihabitans sp.]|nr:TrkA family potassium uptake protein [Jatrophihabitans sp.]